MAKSKRFSSDVHLSRDRCKPEELCPRCSLFEVIRRRFDAFRQKFGREPDPNEPLFFDPDCDHPVQIELAPAVDQIVAAARELNLKIKPILDLLNIDLDACRPLHLAPADTERANYPNSLSQDSAQSDNPRRRPKHRGGAVANPKPPRPALSVVRGRRPAPAVRGGLRAASARAWRAFVSDETANRRHNISSAEWRILAQVALMGEVQRPRDLVFILNMIRSASGA